MDSINSLLELSVTSTLWIWINRPTVQSTRTRTSTTNPNPEKHRSRQFRAGNQGPPAAPLTLRAKIDLPASEFASPPNGHGNKNLLRHAVPTCWQQGSACVEAGRQDKGMGKGREIKTYVLGQELALEVPGGEEGVVGGEPPPCRQPEP